LWCAVQSCCCCLPSLCGSCLRSCGTSWLLSTRSCSRRSSR
jgi:hypothetical protein